MHRTIAAAIDADAERVAAILRDLGNYPDWLDLVTRAEPAAEDGAWMVTLRARVGPLARSKRLRMLRTIDEPRRLRFERAELDGREHAPWTLDVTLEGDSPCHTTVDLRYGGRLWSAPLDAILGSQVDDAIPRLQDLLVQR